MNINPIARLIERYRALPRIPFKDKVRFAVWKYLFRQLEARRIVDCTGELLEARFEKKTCVPQKTYRELIFTCGFGWSGSSATRDLILEYAPVTGFPSEFDLARAAGGVYSLEHAFETRNIFERDAALRVFLALVDHTYVNGGSLYGEGFLEATRKFVNQLIDYTSMSKDGFDNCPHLKALGTRAIQRILGTDSSVTSSVLFFLKEMKVETYRKIASQYLRNVLQQIDSNPLLVLDQGCADCSAEMDRFEAYFGQFKAIYTYRDPRDVFCAANNARRRGQDEGYIPEDARSFVKWYARALAPFKNFTHPNLMLLRFEDLVVDADNTIPRIESFLGLAPSDHTMPHTRFMPEESCAISLGLWEEYDDQDSIQYILDNLSEFCYLKQYVRPERKLYTSTGVRA